jgi:hypothetical protein
MQPNGSEVRDMRGDTTLSSLLDQLRDAEARVEVPARVEAAVMQAWDAAHPLHVGSGFLGRRSAQREDGSRTMWRSAAAVAAGVTLTFALAQLGNELRSSVMTTADDSEATLLLVGDPILEGEPVRVVRMRMPAAALVRLGVRPIAVDSADAIDVEVIVGEDGVARAIKVGM